MENNKIIGYWSQNTYQLEPGIAQVSDETRGRRDNAVATADYERYLSKLDEKYLLEIARDIHGKYIRGDNLEDVLTAMREQKKVRHVSTSIQLDWILAALAGLMTLIAYLPYFRFDYLSYIKFRNSFF